MDTFANGIARVAKKARAAVAEELWGDKGVLSTLREDHERLIWTLNEIGKTAFRDRRMELYGRLRVALRAHSEAEEVTVYLKLSQAGEAACMTQSAQEHELARELSRELDALSYEDDRWMDTFKRFASTIKRHIEHEEKSTFRLLRARVRPNELIKLDKEFRRAKLHAIQNL